MLTPGRWIRHCFVFHLFLCRLEFFPMIIKHRRLSAGFASPFTGHQTHLALKLLRVNLVSLRSFLLTRRRDFLPALFSLRLAPQRCIQKPYITRGLLDPVHVVSLQPRSAQELRVKLVQKQHQVSPSGLLALSARGSSRRLQATPSGRWTRSSC